MNFLFAGVKLNKNSVYFKPNIGCFIISSRLQSTITKPILRRHEKFKSIGPFGWFLLVIPISAFSLGIWQVRRKQWKESLLAELQERVNCDPLPLPTNLEQIKELEYKPVHVKGTFLHDQEIYVGPRSLLSKGDAATQSALYTGKSDKGHGYLVVTPFKLADRNETILVNRGWVPSKRKDQKTRQDGQVKGEVDLVGLVRLHENRPTFMPKNQGTNVYFYRDLHQMSAVTGASPVFLDATNDFDVPNGPIGGQTRISLRNEHLSYILTWFTMCGATSYMWYAKFIK